MSPPGRRTFFFSVRSFPFYRLVVYYRVLMPVDNETYRAVYGGHYRDGRGRGGAMHPQIPLYSQIQQDPKISLHRTSPPNALLHMYADC